MPAESVIDPALVSQLSANLLVMAQHSVERSARQSDTQISHLANIANGALYDGRALGGFMASALFTSDDPSQDALLNSAVRTPSTLEHPQYYPSPLQGSPIKAV